MQNEEIFFLLSSFFSQADVCVDLNAEEAARGCPYLYARYECLTLRFLIGVAESQRLPERGGRES